MKRLGNVKVPQKSIVSWHAKLTQAEDSVRRLVNVADDMTRREIARELEDILADLGALRGHLPPVQTGLLFSGRAE